MQHRACTRSSGATEGLADVIDASNRAQSEWATDVALLALVNSRKTDIYASTQLRVARIHSRAFTTRCNKQGARV